MRWMDLVPGDTLIDPTLSGNDHILVPKEGNVGTWISIKTGAVETDKDTDLNDKVVRNWNVIRGDRTIWR